MSRPTPLREEHEAYARGLRDWVAAEVASGNITTEASLEASVEWLPYGAGDDQAAATEIVGTYGMVEAEYAAIRRGAGVIDRSQRGIIRVTGADRRDFLNRMLTQELKHLDAGAVAQSFWLKRTGRIESDMLLLETGDEMLIDLDAAQLSATIESLASYVFAEDIELTDDRTSWARLALHGPRALEVVGAIADEHPFLLAPSTCRTVSVGTNSVTCFAGRADTLGEIGIELFVPREHAVDVWRAMLASDDVLADGKRRIRPVGWYAYNIARIEAGTPLMNIDFGPTNLPHETGIVRDRVSFTKGCYLGQEIVARMESRARAKQVLVGLRVQADALPVAGAQVFAAGDDAMGNPVGAITSSTLSPMLGAVPICFAMMNAKHAEAETSVLVNAEGAQVPATVQGLQFWKRDPAHATGDTLSDD